MAALERTYNVPLRKEWLKVSLYRRAKKAGTALRDFLMRHMKSEHVLIGKHLNEAIWAHGIKNPPHHIKVTCVKGDDGIVHAELFGAKLEQKLDKKLEKKADKPIEVKKAEKSVEMKVEGSAPVGKPAQVKKAQRPDAPKPAEEKLAPETKEPRKNRAAF